MIHNIVQMSTEAQTASTTFQSSPGRYADMQETRQYPPICEITSSQERCDLSTLYRRNEPSRTTLLNQITPIIVCPPYLNIAHEQHKDSLNVKL